MSVVGTFPIVPSGTTGGIPGSTSVNVGFGAGSFLGKGLLRPFERDLKNDFAHDAGEPLIRASIGTILSTMCSSDITQGELPWRTEFGSLLYLLRHQQNSIALAELARVHVVDALRRWEPRINIKKVNVQQVDSATGQAGPNNNVLKIQLVYDIISANRAGNMVLLPGIQQIVSISI